MTRGTKVNDNIVAVMRRTGAREDKDENSGTCTEPLPTHLNEFQLVGPSGSNCPFVAVSSRNCPAGHTHAFSSLVVPVLDSAPLNERLTGSEREFE